MRCETPGGRVITKSPIKKHLWSFYFSPKPSADRKTSMSSTLGGSPFWTSPLACLTSYRVNLSWKSGLLHWESPGRWSGNSHNWIMWPWLFCFSPKSHLWWIPKWLAQNLALQTITDPVPCLWGAALVILQPLKPLCVLTLSFCQGRRIREVVLIRHQVGNNSFIQIIATCLAHRRPSVSEQVQRRLLKLMEGKRDFLRIKKFKCRGNWETRPCLARSLILMGFSIGLPFDQS